MPKAAEEITDILERLAARGIDYREVAARLIGSRLAKEIESLPEFDMPKPLKKGGRKGADTVKIDLSIGRNKRIAPNFILGALVDATGMSGQDFGKIDIFDTHTTVEVPEAEMDYILDSTNSMKINGNKVEVKLYKGGSKEKSSGKDKSFKEKSGRDKARGFDKKGNKPDRRKSAYGNRKKSDVFGDYTPDRRRRTKKRH